MAIRGRDGKLEALTTEEAAELPRFREEWLQRGFCTEPADRVEVERGMEMVYSAIGKEPPRLRIWMDSPLGGCYAATILLEMVRAPHLALKPGEWLGDQLWGQLGDRLWGQLRDQLGEQLRDQLGGQLGDQLWDQLRDQLWGQLWDQLRGQLGGQLREQLRGQLRGQVGDQLWEQLWEQVGGQLWSQLWGQLSCCWYGQHDIPWIAWYEFARQVGVQLPDRLDTGLGGLRMLAGGGWWWPYEGFVILTDRPSVVTRDERGRLHCSDGPAVAYRDGYGLWAVHGVRVPQEVIEVPETLTAGRILDEPNAEVRRVMIERHGQEKFLRAAGAQVVDEDTDGLGFPRRLHRVQIPGDENLVMVEVTNSTPEPAEVAGYEYTGTEAAIYADGWDVGIVRPVREVYAAGRHKTYMLRVAPSLRTCQGAIASTWRYPDGSRVFAEGRDYQLAAES